MQVRVIARERKAKWDEYVNMNKNSIAWHGYEWARVVRKNVKAKFIPLAAVDGEGIRGILPLYLIKFPFQKKRLISVPYAVAGGIVSDSSEAVAKLVEEGIRLAKELGAEQLLLKQYKIQIPGHFVVDQNFYNRELRINRSADELWKAISRRNREKIEKMESTALEIEYPSREVASFYRMLSTFSHLSGIPCVSNEWIRALIDFGMYSIALVRSKGRIVAGTMVKVYKKTVSFPFTCYDPIGENNKDAVYFLYWRLIQTFAKDGMEIFHSGRLSEKGGAQGYRLGWGGKKYRYYYQYYPPSVTRTEVKIKRGGKRQFVAHLWQKLPCAITRLMEPHIVKRFP